MILVAPQGFEPYEMEQEMTNLVEDAHMDAHTRNLAFIASISRVLLWISRDRFGQSHPLPETPGPIARVGVTSSSKTASAQSTSAGRVTESNTGSRRKPVHGR